ncbi:MAG TPA: hypothetical protein PK509_11960 [Catalimonadaceae bacterium]|nr:hypothetical protein [Catalimonadaceae bacterium]
MKKNFVYLCLAGSLLTAGFTACTDETRKDNKPLSGPTLRFDSVGGVKAGSSTLFGSITNSGGLLISGKGILYSDTTSNPTFKHVVKVATGEGTGLFSTAATPLKPRTTYYARLFARNYMDTTYSDVITFFSAPALAKVSAGVVSEFGRDTLNVSSTLTDNSFETIYDRGFVYGEFTNPTLVNTIVSVNSDSTENGFSTVIRNLGPGRRYYIRPFVRNRGGVGYGAQAIVVLQP